MINTREMALLFGAVGIGLYLMSNNKTATDYTDTLAGLSTLDQARAMLTVIRKHESANDYARVAFDPFRVTDFSQHPGAPAMRASHPPFHILTDAQCAAAGFGPGCHTSASGAYQLTWSTWNQISTRLALTDFSPASQDAAALQLLIDLGALDALMDGDVEKAFLLSGQLKGWASMPGSKAGQGNISMETALAEFTADGGTV